MLYILIDRPLRNCAIGYDTSFWCFTCPSTIQDGLLYCHSSHSTKQNSNGPFTYQHHQNCSIGPQDRCPYKVEQRIQANIVHIEGQEFFFFFWGGFFPSSEFPRSLHSPWFSGRTPGGLCRTRPIQNSEFSALEWLELSGDSPVIVRCMLVRLLSPTDFSGGQSARISPNQQAFPPEITGQQRKVRRSPAEGPTDSSGKSNGQQSDQLTYYYYYKKMRYR